MLLNAVVGRAFEELGVENQTVLADGSAEFAEVLPVMVKLGLQKICGFQHDDGGWGWWYDDSSSEYQTAYVLFGFAATRDAGYSVDAGVIERGVTWVSGEIDTVFGSSCCPRRAGDGTNRRYRQ